jgi:hypothetical protein
MMDIILPDYTKVICYEKKKEEQDDDIIYNIKTKLLLPSIESEFTLYYSYTDKDKFSHGKLKHTKIELSGPKTYYWIKSSKFPEKYNARTFPLILEYVLPKFYEKLFYNNIKYEFIPHGRYDKSYIRVKLFRRKIDIPVTLISQNTTFEEKANVIDLILFFKHDPKVKEAALKITKDTVEDYSRDLSFGLDNYLSKYKEVSI